MDDHLRQLRDFAEFEGRISGVVGMEADGWLSPTQAITRIAQIVQEFEEKRSEQRRCAKSVNVGSRE